MRRSLEILIVIAAVALWCALWPGTLFAQTPSTAAMIAGCPSPTPTGTVGWPPSTCAYTWYPITDGTHAIAAGSKTSPSYAHTWSGYAASTLIVACPAGAIVSGASCTSGGKDVSALVAKSQVASFALAPPVTPPPTCPDTFVPVNWTCTSANGVATCTAPLK